MLVADIRSLHARDGRLFQTRAPADQASVGKAVVHVWSTKQWHQTGNCVCATTN